MNNNRRNAKKNYRIIYLIMIFLAFLIGSDVYMSNRLATIGLALEKTEQKITALESENQTLLADGVEEFSLHQLAVKAKKYGFVKPNEVIDMDDISQTLAMR